MALIASLLLTMVLSTALGGVAMIAAMERRSAAAYAVSLQLRFAAEGALALTTSELRSADWDAVLSGAGSAHWQRSLSPALDSAALTQAVQRQTVMDSSHGADTPVWRLFAQMPWSAVSRSASAAQTLVWVADDWGDGDGDPARDRNGLILVRVTAVAGVASASTEALCGREAGGQVGIRHIRSW